jgi:hypothetical protein
VIRTSKPILISIWNHSKISFLACYITNGGPTVEEIDEDDLD